MPEAISKQESYTPAQNSDVIKWTSVAEQFKAGTPADKAKLLDLLNSHLATRTTILGTRPSPADLAVYEAVAPAARQWTPEQRTGKTGHPHVLRLLDFVQNSPVFELKLTKAERIIVDPEEILYVAPPVDAKAEKERLKKEKAAAGGAGGAAESKDLADRTKKEVKEAKEPEAKEGAAAPPPEGKKKKEKKEKQPKAQKAPAAPAQPPSPALIDLRVGHILKAIKHPEADSLYVSTIAMGDAAGTPDTDEYEGQVVRTVCSGLNGLVPLEEMQGRRVVVVCNLKPVKMRGIKSAAMVLAASPRLTLGEEDHHAGPVELVNPPADAPAGTKVFFEGWQGTPEKQLNPKKKVWETYQPGFTTTPALEVAFDAAAVASLGAQGLGKLVTATGQVCTVKSLAGATVR